MLRAKGRAKACERFLGIGGLGAIIVLVVGLFLGIDPSTLLALLSGDQAQPQQTDTQTVDAHPSQRSEAGHDRTRQFVAVVLADTEDVWRQVFESSGKTYVELRSAVGAQRKYGTLPTDFRSPSENDPSRYGHLTARFARFR